MAARPRRPLLCSVGSSNTTKAPHCGNIPCLIGTNAPVFLASRLEVCEHPNVPERRGLI